MHWTGSVPRVAFSIGDTDVAWYGLIITFAMLLSLVLALVRNKKIGLTVDDGLELFLCAIPLGILFARFGHVFARPDEYLLIEGFGWSDFLEIFAIWDGGLTILTGVIGGVFGAWLWAKWRKVDFVKTADHIICVVLLTQAIGRWGNFFNQEIYGQLVTDPSLQWFPYSVFISARGGFYQAIFFYESMANLLAFAITWFLVPRVDIRGYGIASYLASYCTIRFILEFFRNANIVSSTVVIIIMVCCALIAVASIAYIIFMLVKKKKSGERIFYLHGIPTEILGNIHLSLPKTGETTADEEIKVPEKPKNKSKK